MSLSRCCWQPLLRVETVDLVGAILTSPTKLAQLSFPIVHHG
jgi:hypothetical protein